jgi:glyoxylase-like metal-dependent hydrolase (beta-lactamase superfamily II)
MTQPLRRWKVIVWLAVLGIAAAALVAVVYAPHTTDADPAALPGGKGTHARQPPDTVAPGIHLLAELGPSAAYLVEVAGGFVLIDSGLDADCQALKRQIAGLGLKPADLKMIFLTHAHGDHTLGARHLKSLSGAKICAGKGDCQAIRQGAPVEAVFSVFPMTGVAIHPTEVDVELAGGEVFTFGDRRLEAIAAPGHTPGSMCYRLLQNDGPSALFTGDTVMTLSRLGTYSVHIAPRYGGAAGDYLATLRMLQGLAPPDLMLPGHPDEYLSPPDVRLSASAWRGLLAQGISELEQLLARRKADEAHFLDNEPKQILPGVCYLGDHRGRAVYGMHSAAGLWLFDAPGPGLVEFLEARLPELEVRLADLRAVLLTSCDKESLGGLDELVEHTACQVVAAPAGHQAVREACGVDATVLAGNALKELGCPDVHAVPLAGRGLGPMAYRFTSGGKVVLVSGQIPLPLSRALPWPAFEPAVSKLRQSLQPPLGSSQSYLASLETLRDMPPNVWLPAEPIGGQSAHLYGSQWEEMLMLNGQVVRRQQ